MVIRVLDLKVLRDIWSLRGQVLTIALMIGAGVAVLIASVSAWLSLVHEQEAFYTETRFADVFVEMRRAPRALLPRLAAAIPPIVHPATFAMAVLIVFVAGAASALAVSRQVNRLDLVAALKARD